MARRTLDDSSRALLTLVSRAAFENPFGVERDRLDSRIAEVAPSDPDLLAKLVARIRAGLESLGGQDVDIQDYEGTDRDLVEHTVLFLVFHHYAQPMDAHIERQTVAGSEPLEVGFAPELLSRLRRHGLDAERSSRMLSLFYQMRRAWFFIARGLVGRSASMRGLRESLWNAVFTHDIRTYERFLWNRMEDFSTILLGETGTGKGAAAAAIGRSGHIPFDARNNAFVESVTDTFLPINLSQYSAALIESELFGHQKGAFTGAIDSHKGAFSRCSARGSIFLDEIGEVDAPVQIKLLDVLQSRTFSPVGSHRRERFSGRIIAATHRPLDELRRAGKFRDDFYYRLSSDTIVVPPLRVRLGEDPAELDALLEVIVPRLVGAPAPELAEMVRTAIDRDLGPAYSWPGNVRELEQCVRRVLLTRHCQPDRARERSAGDTLAVEMAAGTLSADELVARYCALLYARHGTYVEVAKRTGLDRRTVKKHVDG